MPVRTICPAVADGKHGRPVAFEQQVWLMPPKSDGVALQSTVQVPAPHASCAVWSGQGKAPAASPARLDVRVVSGKTTCGVPSRFDASGRQSLETPYGTSFTFGGSSTTTVPSTWQMPPWFRPPSHRPFTQRGQTELDVPW